MAADGHFLGIDINAFGLAFSLHDASCAAVGGLRRSFGEQSGPGEHDPADWWRAVRTGVKELLRRNNLKPGNIRAIGLTGMSQACVLLDKEHNILFPALVGSSEKLSGFAEELRSQVGQRNLGNLAGTGFPISSGAMATKLLAIRETAPRVWHDLAHVLSPRDYLRFRLADTFSSDPSMASRSLLFSPRTVSWSKQILDRLEIDPDILPALTWGNRISGRISEAAARETGLPAGVPIVAGGSHQSCAAIACGLTDSGDICIELGSNGSVTILSNQAKRDLQGILSLRCHCLEKMWTLQSDEAAAGTTYDWFTSQIVPSDVQQARRAKKDPLEHFCSLAAESEPGSNGIQCLPLGRSSGALLGLKPHHHKGDVIRSFFEGTALDIASVLQQGKELGIEPGRILVSGPGARSTLWPQIVSDAIGLPLETVDLPHLCARGAAVLAAVASGAIKNLDKAIAGQLNIHASFEPRPAATAVYESLIPQRAALKQSLESGSPADQIELHA